MGMLHDQMSSLVFGLCLQSAGIVCIYVVAQDSLLHLSFVGKVRMLLMTTQWDSVPTALISTSHNCVMPYVANLCSFTAPQVWPVIA